jgi:formamidopyrimidine-DNA glycosylase
MSPETQAKQLSSPRKTRIVERKAKVKQRGIGKFLTSLSGFLTARPRHGRRRVSTLESTPGLRTSTAVAPYLEAVSQ